MVPTEKSGTPSKDPYVIKGTILSSFKNTGVVQKACELWASSLTPVFSTQARSPSGPRHSPASSTGCWRAASAWSRGRVTAKRRTRTPVATLSPGGSAFRQVWWSTAQVVSASTSWPAAASRSA